VATVAALEPDDRGTRLSRVRNFYDKYREQLVSHHTHEDRLFFPALAVRVGEDRIHLNELVSQHQQLDAVLQEAGEGLAALADRDGDFSVNRTRVTGVLSTMVEMLTTHLDLEEKAALPLFVSDMPAAEYQELESNARKATPRGQSGFMIPWVVEHGSPDQRKAFRTAPPLRIVYWLNRRRYRRIDFRDARRPPAPSCSRSGISARARARTPPPRWRQNMRAAMPFLNAVAPARNRERPLASVDRISVAALLWSARGVRRT
jgi:hemerythrin-like domain-containing protein